MSLVQSSHSTANPSIVRNNWRRGEVRVLFAPSLPELMFAAARVHRMHFDPAELPISALLSNKSGGCPDHRAY